ncbi:caspase family protein [Agromyces atrinae]|uniref:Caspase family protein n=1 Tax=Agromyces atrinae TaxID=592376 RepID=A0A4Q2M207_9MICO|nr:caspase family protein [Agromyces atrinae]NYD65492.1 hypothetical protein [Agromyces atrinae]RXZ85778.1 caspase family protein [Agromyces atrinae]
MSLSPAQLKALKPHVITLDDGRLDRSSEENLDPQSIAEFTTVTADIRAIVETHLPAFIDAHDPADVPIVIFAHGGLVDLESGFEIAERQVAWWKANGVYPIHFVWRTGLVGALSDAIVRWLTGGTRGWFDETKDLLVEKGARLLGGGAIWNDMKLDAAASSDPHGGARVFATQLGAWMGADPRASRVSVHAIGHSAGSIFHSHFIPMALDENVPEFRTVTFLAPAVRMDTFEKMLLPRADSIGSLAVFTMHDAAEHEDTCLDVYGKSLLYLVSRAFEPVVGTPILGLAASIEQNERVSRFLDGDGGDLVLGPNERTDRSGTAAEHHGDFDNDPPTMNSVARRILERDDIVPFTADSRSVEPRDSVPPVPADSSRSLGGAKRALCIGIDEYPQTADRLSGAVADARAWRDMFSAAAFETTLLTNAEATREQIVGSIFQLITEAQPGDVLAVQYSGHGTRTPDLNADEGEGEPDSALCPVDFRGTGRVIIDDDLGALWDLAADGVSLSIFFDSCHSGGANRAPGGMRGDSRPRAVELTDADERAYRVARGVAGPRGRTRAAEASDAAENGSRAVPQASGVRREVLFAACDDDELAWETSGHGDFTSHVAPLVREHIGRVTNRAFYDALLIDFPSTRQTPRIDGSSAVEGSPFLAVELGSPASIVDGGADGAPASARTASPRDAAIAAILRGVADLIVSD